MAGGYATSTAANVRRHSSFTRMVSLDELRQTATRELLTIEQKCVRTFETKGKYCVRKPGLVDYSRIASVQILAADEAPKNNFSPYVAGSILATYAPFPILATWRVGKGA